MLVGSGICVCENDWSMTVPASGCVELPAAAIARMSLVTFSFVTGGEVRISR